MTLMEQHITALSQEIMIPLSAATESSLRKTKVWSSDRVELDLDDTASRFIVEVFQVSQRKINELSGGGEMVRISLVDNSQYLLIEKPDEQNFWREVDKRKWDPDEIRQYTQLVHGYLNGTEYVPQAQIYNALWELHFGRRTGASQTAAEEFFKCIPEKEKLGYGKFKCAATDVTALVIHHTFSADQILFKNDDACDLYYYLLKRFLLQAKSGIARARFKLKQGDVVLPKDWVEHPDRPLTDYQRVAALGAIESRDVALFMEMGTGKTPTAIQVVQMEGKRAEAMTRNLIVCPRAVRINWQHEFERFCVVPGQVTVIRGGQLERAKLLVEGLTPEEDSQFAVIIASYETIHCSWGFFKRIPWDRVICDESHMFRNTYTKRWEVMEELRDLCERKLLLTGTPIANSIMDLWSQLEFLGEGLSGFLSKNAYKKFYGRWKQLKGGVEKLVAMQNVPLIQERLVRLAFQLTKQEAGMKLPPKVYDEHEIQMTKKQAEIYARTAAALVVEIENLEKSGMNESMTVEHILTKLLRLAQITSGFYKPDRVLGPDGDILNEGQPKQIESGNPKIDALLEHVRNLGEHDKMIVWACFREDIRAISAALASIDIGHRTYFGGVREADREANVDAFNCDPSCKVFVANPEAGGTGLNLIGYNYKDPEDQWLPTNCTHMIFFSQNWKPLLRSQGEDRSHRRGTRMPLRITDLVVPGSIDEEIRSRVLHKHNMALALTNVREIAKRILNTAPSTQGDD